MSPCACVLALTRRMRPPAHSDLRVRDFPFFLVGFLDTQRTLDLRDQPTELSLTDRARSPRVELRPHLPPTRRNTVPHRRGHAVVAAHA